MYSIQGEYHLGINHNRAGWILITGLKNELTFDFAGAEMVFICNLSESTTKVTV